ncbi:M23 family metallopeptidase [Streptomyces sp. NPDC001889]
MNDQHAHAGHVGHDQYPTGSFDIDPLFGALPDGQTGYEAGHSGQYEAAQWDTGAHRTVGGYDMYAGQDQGQQFPAPDSTGAYETVTQWDSGAWEQVAATAPFEPAATFAYGTADQWAAPGGFDSGSYDATAWNTESGAEALVPQQFAAEREFTPEYGAEFTAERQSADAAAEHAAEFGAESTGYETEYENGFDAAPLGGDTPGPDPDPGHTGPDEGETPGAPALGDTASFPVISDTDGEHGREAELVAIAADEPAAPRSGRRSSGGGGSGRGRRRTPAKRSAIFTIAVPSACVMGVAGIAAASVGGLSGGGEEPKKNDTKLAAADVAETAAKTAAANNKMDTQLAALDAEARNFGDRASRTQERIDLKARQEADRKKRVAEAERREALRPKFAMPVESRGLSTYYGESGVNWMALHTGIDFPVPLGTNVFAASDGTVRTQFNSAYGNMIILTAPDGTETWYCHLSSAKIRSGTVKAGDVIGYAGNTGNSTGSHLHFEVRPGGGSTIDPLAWLRSKGLDPT